MSSFIYIVDDDADVRESLRALLATRFYGHILAFPSGDAFLEDIDSRESGVVLLDIYMPGRSGLDVLECLHHRRDPHEIIVITGHGNVRSAVTAMKFGASDYLEKPCRQTELFAAIDSSFSRLSARLADDQQRRKARRCIDRLTERERQVLEGLIDGKSKKAIGASLKITARTVEFHRANVMGKLGVETFPEAMRLMLLAERADPVHSHRV